MRAASSAAQRASAASLSSEEYEMKTSWAIGRFKLNADWNPLRASRPRQERRSLFRTSRGKTVERQAVESLDVVGGLVVDEPPPNPASCNCFLFRKTLRRYRHARHLLRALFERGGLTLQIRECFTGEMERAGDQNWCGSHLSLCECFINRWSDRVGE